ncbi:MAG: hypothetical protein ACD_17C00294G0001, partial [uncultured bacterium]
MKGLKWTLALVNMSLALMLKIRAQKLQEARRFFETRNVLEVDCGALVKRAPLDPNIDCL